MVWDTSKKASKIWILLGLIGIAQIIGARLNYRKRRKTKNAMATTNSNTSPIKR